MTHKFGADAKKRYYELVDISKRICVEKVAGAKERICGTNQVYLLFYYKSHICIISVAVRDLLAVNGPRGSRYFWASAIPLQTKLSSTKRKHEDGTMGGAASKKTGKMSS